MELDLLIRTFHAAKPEPSRARGGEEEPALLGPNFLAAFPEAPATSSAARIPAEGELGTHGNTKPECCNGTLAAHTRSRFTLQPKGGSSHGSPVVQSASAPGWENVPGQNSLLQTPLTVKPGMDRAGNAPQNSRVCQDKVLSWLHADVAWMRPCLYARVQLMCSLFDTVTRA